MDEDKADFNQVAYRPSFRLEKRIERETTNREHEVERTEIYTGQL